ncbi:MAG: PolC-type DNA polymerase III [Faecousia sp.]
MKSLLTKYSRLLVFDTETTGLSPRQDEIIEFSAAVVELREAEPRVIQEYDNLVSLSPGRFVPPKIQQLTGITDQDLAQKGISKTRLCRDVAELLAVPDTLLLAYNAHFDLCFLYYTLQRDGDPAILRGKDKVDLLTVYRDRRSYPHRLASAIESYGLSDRVQNSHRAIDDVLATVAVLEAMGEEKDDLLNYVNIFGYNARYGLEGKPIGSVTYRPQGYEPARPIYEAL